MVIAIRKEPNGSIYIDKNIREDINYTEPPYNFTLREISDKYIDVESCDFNNDLSLNIDKYTARKEREFAEYNNYVELCKAQVKESMEE